MTDSPCAFARLAIVLFLGALGAFAQAPANSGSIEGRVLNATNRQFIKNAQIAIEGARTAVSSNEFGEYRLSDVPAGTVRLRITYGGLDEQTLVVEVGPGAVVQRDITLTRGVPADLREGTVQLDEFKVTAERDLNAASLATNEQHHAANIKTAAGKLLSLNMTNINASPAYVKLYNKASAPDQNDTPVMVFTVPGNTAGAGNNPDLGPFGLAFALGIGIRIVTGVADNNTTAVAANEVIVNAVFL